MKISQRGIETSISPESRLADKHNSFPLYSTEKNERAMSQGLLLQFSHQEGITSARKIANAVAVADGGLVNAQTRYLPVHA
ncbi:hypothetical protein ALC53_13889 [Atta colombica]|uniref:Uncharacterized protein n=1 Tax=Atta colombica TaxID=520822 RepID=A0A195AV23_9HYME|nr:hypothetical protein ALC53_13889 [Atta colombica]